MYHTYEALLYNQVVRDLLKDKLAALSLRRFGEFVRLAEAKHALAVFDSCFAGTIFEAQRALPPPAITRATTLPVRQFLTSGDAGQTVSDDGTFRKLFLRALRGEERANGNGDGYLTASELGLFLSDRMVNLRLGQAPRYGKLRDPDYDRGDFVFVLPNAEGGAGAPAVEAGVVGVDLQVWDRIEDSTDTADFETFIETFPSSPMMGFALNRLEKLGEEEILGPGSVSLEEMTAYLAWGRIKTSTDRADFVTFIENFPASPMVPFARSKLKAMIGVETALVVPPEPETPAAEPAVGVYPETFRDCAECPEMVVIPAGEFVMGSPKSEYGRYSDESPRHTVRIERPFALGKYEATFGEWDACVADGACGGYRPQDYGWGRGERPVINASWDDAKAYLDWLSRKTGRMYRLASESEWEYAARAGTTTARFWGESVDRACGYANAADLSAKRVYSGLAVPDCDDGYAHTAPVGSFAANAFGLHDVLGNVWEWVEDCQNDSYDGAPTDGSAWRSGDCQIRVPRGGSWYYIPGHVRSANRDWAGTETRLDDIGFRVARTLDLSGEAREPAPPVNQTAFFDIPEMLVNLALSGDQPNYMKLTVSLEIVDPRAVPRLQQLTSRIVNNFQRYLRGLSIEDLSGSAGVYRVKEALLALARGTVKPIQVADVLFKEMLIK